MYYVISNEYWEGGRIWYPEFSCYSDFNKVMKLMKQGSEDLCIGRKEKEN